MTDRPSCRTQARSVQAGNAAAPAVRFASRARSRSEAMNDSGGAAGSAAIRAGARAASFLVLCLVLAGADVADLPAAAVAVVPATWTSLRLLPPGSSRLSPSALAHLTLRF